MTNEFQLILTNQEYHDKLYLFLQNIFKVLPEDKFFNLIKHNASLSTNDKEIYSKIQRELSGIKPLMADIRYGLPSLFKQKRVIAEQTKQLLGESIINSYMEIGTVGRYIPNLKKKIKLGNQLYIANEKPAGYGPLDIIDRGQITINFNYIPLNSYAPLDLPANSLDMISCYIGLHHIELDKLEPFIKSIFTTLKPGGKFVLRDHNCSSHDMIVFVSLIHTIFNIGSNVSQEENFTELRYFRPIKEWIEILNNQGFDYCGRTIYQDYDPSDNGLMLFTKLDE